jgi:hypothetical protein
MTTRTVSSLDAQGRQRECGGGIAATGFEEDGGMGDADFLHLLRHEKAIFFVADQQGRQQLASLRRGPGPASARPWPGAWCGRRRA